MSNKKKILVSVLSLGGVQIANYVLPLISIPIVSRIIGPDKFGVINYSTAFVSYFVLLITYGFDFSATREVSKNPLDLELRSKIFSQVLYAKLLLFAVSLCVFLVCLFNVPPLAAEKKVAIFCFVICFSSIFSQNWLFQAMQQLPKVAILNLVGKFVFTISVLFFIKEKSDYVWQPMVASLSQIIIALLSFYWSIKLYKLYFIKFIFKDIVDLIVKERVVFFSLIVISLYTTTNTIMLGLLRSENEVGFYTASQRLIDVLSSVISAPLSQTLFPFVAVAFAESKEKGIQVVQKIIPVILFAIGLICCIVFFIGPIFLSLFYGAAFNPSIQSFKIISFLPLVIALSNVLGIQVMLNLKLDKLFFKVTASGAVVGLLLNYMMSKRWGYVGTAWNCLIVESYIVFAMYYVLKKRDINILVLKAFRWSSIKELLRKNK